MPLTNQQIIAGIEGLLGHVLSDPARMASYVEEPRRRFHVPALAVAVPTTVADVQKLVAWANDNRVPLIPQGGNTGLVGGQVPLAGNEVIVSTTRLQGVREVNAEAGHMTLEAGVILEQAQRLADEAGALFPLHIASQGSARIGGVLSTNAGGVGVLAYGNARALCLGVEAVLADGRLYQGLSSLRKDNTGYDLKDLLVGAEGTLGIITAATLKLFPKPEDYETALVNVATPDDALQLFHALSERAGGRLTAFELLPRFGIEMLLQHGMIERDPAASHAPWYCLIEVSRMRGTPEGTLVDGLAAAVDAGLVADAAVAGSLRERALMWAARENLSEVQSREGASIKHDVSVPIAQVPRLIGEGSLAAARLVPGIRPCPFGHMGDGNIHFNFTQPAGADGKAFMAGADAVHAAIHEIVARLGGSISAEHGIGQLKTALLKQVKDPVALDMMRAIKRALDPNGILNPGKVLV
ncbi:FAD-binding oxidoreductase [Devosia sp.]|uniref:FAD-binding oxidoreductase n=1 Tax=Devosia sp. TaxID=1871048 RepID=UPI002EFD1C62